MTETALFWLVIELMLSIPIIAVLIILPFFLPSRYYYRMENGRWVRKRK